MDELEKLVRRRRKHELLMRPKGFNYHRLQLVEELNSRSKKRSGGGSGGGRGWLPTPPELLLSCVVAAVIVGAWFWWADAYRAILEWLVAR